MFELDSAEGFPPQVGRSARCFYDALFRACPAKADSASAARQRRARGLGGDARPQCAARSLAPDAKTQQSTSLRSLLRRLET